MKRKLLAVARGDRSEVCLYNEADLAKRLCFFVPDDHDEGSACGLPSCPRPIKLNPGHHDGLLALDVPSSKSALVVLLLGDVGFIQANNFAGSTQLWFGLGYILRRFTCA